MTSSRLTRLSFLGVMPLRPMLLGSVFLGSLMVNCGSDGNATTSGDALPGPTETDGVQPTPASTPASPTMTGDVTGVTTPPVTMPNTTPPATTDPTANQPTTPVVPTDMATDMPVEPMTDCTIPPAPSELVGWATQGPGTTGGGNATPVVVTTANQLQNAIGGGGPAVVHVFGNIQGSFDVGSNKTIIGTCGAEIRGHIEFNGSFNDILRNIRIVGNNCTDSPQDCSSGADAISVQGMSENIWIDHVDVMDGSDGNLDITQGATFVTVSWTKFSYSSARTDPLAGSSGHRFSNLIGASDTDARDPGRLNVTYHHCWWADNVDQRMPRTRRGQIHVFDNLYTSSGNSYCTDSGFEATLLVQNNVYVRVNTPLSLRQGGNMLSEGNDFQNTTGNDTGTGVGFDPPYDFTLDATAGLEAAIRAGAGPQ